MNYLHFRKATLTDIDFLCEAIISAEKSGSDIIPLCRIFELEEDSLKYILKKILEENIEGCELSLSSFLIAEIEGNKASAVAGWIEGENEMHLPSSLIKANLLNYFLPAANINAAALNASAIAGSLIERTSGTLQIEYVYVHPDFRGTGLASTMIEQHLNGVENVFKAEVQVFGNNTGAIRSYEKAGFVTSAIHENLHFRASFFLPDTSKIVMTKNL